jgi:hypothetical protein
MFKIALIIEQPIPEEPPVMMITENRLKYSNCFMSFVCDSQVGFFYAHSSRQRGQSTPLIGTIKKRKNIYEAT